MALTNAERQKRHRQRVKAVLRNASGYAAELRGMVAAEETPTKFLLRVLDGDVHEVGPLLADMLGLPRDPWPGLTHGELKRLFKSTRSALEAGIRIDTGWPAKEASLEEKLRAVAHAKGPAGER